MEIRTLRAEEIECRINMVKPNGVSLLLYKDARVDQNILDEVVGPMNWQRSHTRDNANCIVSIWDDKKQQWVSKEDTGVESRADGTGNEKKGLASDSFKRACFNWGIGRELYTAPFIWIPADKCDINNQKCYDKFEVEKIIIEDKRITAIAIKNVTKGVRAFVWQESK